MRGKGISLRKGIHKITGNIRIIKQYKSSQIHSNNCQPNLNEPLLIKQLDHPNVVKLYS